MGTRSKLGRGTDRRRLGGLAPVVVLQALCLVFFVADVGADLGLGGINRHSLFEAVVAAALAVGVVFGALEIRRILIRTERAEAAQAVASEAFRDLIEATFERWNLTPAEADVAIFALKGLEVAEIARLRGAADGTVRAQLSRLYAKARVSGRAQFLSLFLEELMVEPLDSRDRASASG